jgi:hypothetical protein
LTGIDPGTLSFAIEITGGVDAPKCAPVDINVDGIYDIVCKFGSGTLGTSEQRTLKARLLDDVVTEGPD